MGQRDGFSKNDVQKLNLMYSCSNTNSDNNNVVPIGGNGGNSGVSMAARPTRTPRPNGPGKPGAGAANVANAFFGLVANLANIFTDDGNSTGLDAGEIKSQ